MLKIGDHVKLKFRGMKRVFKILGPEDYIHENCIQMMMFPCGHSYEESLEKFNQKYEQHSKEGNLHELLNKFNDCSFRIDNGEKVKDNHEHRIYLELVK